MKSLQISLLWLLLGATAARADVALLLEEPFGAFGGMTPTGHAAIYLSRVCADSLLSLRRCEQGEQGVVISRYHRIAGYDWIAIPLIPYLYAVDRAEAVPLFADAKLVAFLRDQYRRDHLEALAPDRPDGGTPDGNWYELVGSAYDRTIYGFEIETSPEQDALLINKFNSESNLQRYNFVRRNCADFVREVINFYYPHALHRSVIGDLGVTTPKQIAKMLVKYSHHHPRLRTSDFLIPQVPGAIRRSKPIHGVLESVMAAKKYMVPVVILHPYIGGGLLAEHFFHKGFDPARNALILDSNGQLNPPMTHDERLALQSRLDELSLAPSVGDPVNKGKANEGKNKEVKTWERLQASAQTRLDASGQPFLQMGVDDDSDQVGLSRANIVNGSGAPELGARLLEARIRQELRPASARKTSPSDVRTDLRLYQRLLSFQPRESAVAPASTTNSPVQAPSASQ